MSQKTLENKVIDEINFNVNKIKKVFKNQKIPSSNEQFTDDLFPPNADSLLARKNGKPVDKIKQRADKLIEDFIFDTNNIVWLRASEIFKGRYSVFVDDVSIDDVLQGNLGNCYFMSSLAALTCNPQLIFQIFKTTTVQSNSCYQIAMNIEGQWAIVLLDDYFPCSKKTRVPIFAKPNGPELWAMLLEKAWAKVNGGYLNITGGFAAEVLSVLTSFPIEAIKLKISDEDIIWDKLNTAFKNGEMISSVSNFNEEIEKYGLISGHAFTVTNFVDGFVNGELVRLIRLRNPWGYREWNGPWSDTSPLWTESAKKELLDDNLVVGDDGEFWMSFNDFFKFFCSVDICKVMNPQCVRSIQIDKEALESPNVFELQIFSKTKTVISVIKKCYRFHRTMKTHEELSVNIILVKKIGENLELISSTNSTLSSPTIDVELPVGFYLIYVHCDYKHSTYEKMRKVRLYISSSKYFFIFKKNIDVTFSLLKNVIYDTMKKQIEAKTEKDLGVLTANKFAKTTYGYLIIENRSSDAIRFGLNNKSQNFDLFLPFHEGQDQIEITLPTKNVAVFVGIRKKPFEVYKFSLTIIRHSTLFSVPILLAIQKTLKKDPINIKSNHPLLRANIVNENYLNSINYYTNKDQIESFMLNSPEKEINEDDFDFIYKKLNFNISKLSEKIDYRSNAENYFKEKYPNEMGMILKEVDALNDGENVIFRDVFDFGDSYYIGEWKIKEDLTRHGRGLLVYADGSNYIGQFVNDKREGKGRLNKNNGESIHITWKNDKMEGIGILKKIDGSSKKVFYQEGNFIC